MARKEIILFMLIKNNAKNYINVGYAIKEVGVKTEKEMKDEQDNRGQMKVMAVFHYNSLMRLMLTEIDDAIWRRKTIHHHHHHHLPIRVLSSH